jgi:hypothetical protein
MGFALLDLLSVNTIEGAELPSVNVDVDGTTSERLLVSAVKPPNTQDGAVRSPWSTLVLTTIVDPSLNVA